MSDTERNDDGTFAAGEPDTTGLYGREERLVSAGYTVKKDPEPATPDYSDSADPVREAAAELSAKRGEPEDPITVRDMLGDLDPTEALSVSQAAAEISAARDGIETFYDGLDLAKYVDDIDAKRAAVVDGKPEMAKALGLDDVPKELTKAEQAEAAEIDSMDGLDHQTKAALKIPAVRQAIEEELGKAEHVREQYSTSLHQGQQMLQATVAALAPQLNGMPLEHWPQAIQMLAQVDPVRAQLVSDTLTNWGTIQQAQQQDQQQRAYLANQQFEATRQEYSRASDQAIGPMTVAEKTEMAEELVSYVGEFGISREQFAREAATNLALHHPAFQRMAADAVRYQRLTRSPAKATAKIPPVQRPGTSNAVRGTPASAQVHAIEAQLATAKGDRAVRLAARLSSLRRA